jgi:pyruvate/2-oxoglutarate/acetoin dehydrogenase E1 component
MKKMKFMDAINEAIAEEMYRDEKVLLIGEEVGKPQEGCFAVTKGLEDKFGKDRVVNTPLSEAALGGVFVGAAMFGLRPIVEIMFGTLMTLVADEVRDQAGPMHYISGGKIKVPGVIRTADWMRIVSGPHHYGNFDTLMINSPGIKCVAPSTPADAKGLLKAAIRDNDPVVFLEYTPLYNTVGEVPENEDFVLPIGKADIKKEGTDVTIIGYATTVIDALVVANELEKQNISVEVLDLRTIAPFDKEAIRKSVAKTGRVVVAYDGYKTGGVGSEISAFIAEECLSDLEAPVIRIANKDIPNPCNPKLIEGIAINKQQILDAIAAVLEY